MNSEKIELQSSPTHETCQDCANAYIGWYTPLPHWNKVMGHPQAGFICASCWLARAEAAGESAGTWHLVTQDEWESTPESLKRRKGERFTDWAYRVGLAQNTSEKRQANP